jgi:hypothetical protein
MIIHSKIEGSGAKTVMHCNSGQDLKLLHVRVQQAPSFFPPPPRANQFSRLPKVITNVASILEVAITFISRQTYNYYF